MVTNKTVGILLTRDKYKTIKTYELQGDWCHHSQALQAGLQTCCGHAGDVEVLFPLLLDPLKGEGIADLVALLRVPCAFTHHHQ